MNDVISVVIPVYKIEKYLCACVDSILGQTYSNLDIILVDDGSPDSCPEICDEYAGRDSRIRVIHKENGGLSDARNAGIAAAKGKYITFVDGDDFIFPSMIETLYTLCVKYDADFSACRHIECSDNDTLQTVSAEQVETQEEVFTGREKMRAFFANEKITTMAWEKFYNIRLFENVRFPKGKLHEDVFTTYLLVDSAEKIAVTTEVGYVYRQNPKSIMNSGFSIHRLDAIEGKLNQLAFVDEKYPELHRYAGSGVAYACNVCLREMTIKGYYDKPTEEKIQRLYRRYTKFYLRSKASTKGKVIAVLASISTRLARIALRIGFHKEIQDQIEGRKET